MENSPQTTSLPFPSLVQILPALLLGVGIFLGASYPVEESWGGEPAPLPYVWRDVALVHFVCALPLGWFLAVWIQRCQRGITSILLGIFFVSVGLLPFLNAFRPQNLEAVLSQPFLGTLFRAGPVLCLALGAALISGAMRRGHRKPDQPEPRINLAAASTVGLAVLLFLPMTYTNARLRHDLAQLSKYLELSRYGDAHKLVHQLLVFDPQAKVKGYPLTEVAADIDRIVLDLESRVAVPLAADAPVAERMERARLLAILGKTEPAFDVLNSIHEPQAAPEVDNLRGTIYENQGAWEPALASFRSARTTWTSRPPSPAQAAGLLRATIGIAFCQRNLGRYAEAEATYQQVLALSPTADSHFLLAEFYDHTEQTDKAQMHARQAMTLAPNQYKEQGKKLINKLTVYHFGCLSTFTAGKDAPPAPFLNLPQK